MTDKPIKQIKRGLSNDYIQASIWENNGNNGIHHTVTLTHHYYKDNQWNTTPTLYAQHLPLIQMVSQKSYEFIYDRLEETRKEHGHSAEKEEVVKKAAPAKKRSSRKSHVEELEAKNGASRST